MSEAKPKRPTKLRYSYVEHTNEEVESAIRVAVGESTGVFQDWLTERCLEIVDGPSEFERGVREGRRQLAGQILLIARGDR